MQPRYLALSLSAFLAALVISSPAYSAAPAEVSSCLACHGAQGEGLAAAGYPRLAGLSAPYITEQLNAYIAGRRVNAIMSGMAKPLTAAQIQVIASYFSTLTPHVNPAPPITNLAQAELGQQLALRGDWTAGIPACFSCHAADGAGVSPAFPPLIGQPAAYIEAQIKAWKDGTRQAAPQNLANALMHNVALRMSDAQSQAVAAWLSSLPAAYATPSQAKP
ncbi:MAG: cytochrome c [Halothiobacillaceae bacterium]